MKYLIASLTLCLMASGSFAQDKKPRLPNIVVVLADDLGYGDPGCYNKDSLIPTPNIDKLAGQGLRFTDAHTPSSVCTPTRYGVMTGRYCWRSSLKQGVLHGYSPALIEPGRMTLASLLKQLGYFTAGVGKWHLGLGNARETDFAKPLRPGPITAGFDYYFGIPASLDMPPYVWIENETVTAAPTGTIAGRKDGKQSKVFWRGGPIAADFKFDDVMDRLTDKAVSIIRKQSAERPFFLYFAMTAPHMPVLPKKEFAGKSKAGAYGDFVMELDHDLGRVLKALDEAKLADNTLVIFTSDNGGYWTPEDVAQWKHRSNGNLHGQKSDIWEGGHRVPFIARWPGKVPAGSTSGEVICLTDLLATAAGIGGARLPDDAGEDSFDITPIFFGKKLSGPLRPATIHHSGGGAFAIRQGPWRLCPVRGSHGFSTPRNIPAKAGEPPGELYNLEQDLAETTNRWLQEPAVVARLTALLEKLKADGRSRPGR